MRVKGYLLSIKFRGLFSILISAGLLILALPPFDLEFLAWIAFIPLFLSLKDKDCWSAVYLGFLWGIFFFTGILYWVAYAVRVYGNLSLYTSLIVTFLLILYLSLYPAVFSLCFAYVRRKGGLYRFILLPSLWVSLEYLRGNMFTGFPWELLGYSQYRFLPIIQISDLTGVYGVSFLVLAFNVFLFLLVERMKGRGENLLPIGSIMAFLLILTLFYGYLRMEGIRNDVRGWNTLTIGVVQGNIEQDKKWAPEYQMETVNIYRRETLRLLNNKLPDLIVWPETALPFYLQSDEVYTPLIFDIVKGKPAWLLTGAPGYEYENKKVSYLNSAFLLSQKGFEDRYDKIHLVPFGEYVPLRQILFFASKLVEGVGDFASGKGRTIFDLPKGRFGVVICYEAIFPDLFRQFVKEGARFMVNITNDAWYGRTSAPFQHFSQAVFRSVENRVFLIRSANTGVSGIVSPDGRIIYKTDIFERRAFSGIIGIKKGENAFYTLHGDVFAWINLLFSLSIFFVIMKLQRK